jgi:hypothetical protein
MAPRPRARANRAAAHCGLGCDRVHLYLLALCGEALLEPVGAGPLYLAASTVGAVVGRGELIAFVATLAPLA